MISKPLSGCIGFLNLLAIVFITLKLIGYINWSWWRVLAPLWIQLATIHFLVSIACAGAIIAAIMEKLQNK